MAVLKTILTKYLVLAILVALVLLAFFFNKESADTVLAILVGYVGAKLLVSGIFYVASRFQGPWDLRIYYGSVATVASVGWTLYVLQSPLGIKTLTIDMFLFLVSILATAVLLMDVLKDKKELREQFDRRVEKMRAKRGVAPSEHPATD